MRRSAISAIIILLSAAILLMAQPAPQPSELQRLRLLNAYQHAVLLQQQAQSAQQAFDAARTDYTRLADDVSAEMKLPKGSQFIIDIAAQKVTVQLPPPEPKPSAAPSAVPSETQPAPAPAAPPKEDQPK